MPLAVIAADDATLTVRHAAGTTVIPRHPRRPAVLGWDDQVVALALRPAAIAGGEGWRDINAYLRASLQGVPQVDGTAGTPDLETLAAVAPDVIVASTYWQGDNAAFSRIAPTVFLQPTQTAWRQRFRDLALVLDRQAEGEARLAALEERLAAARTAIHARIGDGSVALVRVFAREFRLYGRSYSGPLLYDDLGLGVPGLVRERAWGREVVRLSIEGLSTLDADHILLMTEEHIPVSFQVRDRLAAHPLWHRIPAVAAGRVHLVPDLVMRGGVLARERMATVLQQALAP